MTEKHYNGACRKALETLGTCAETNLYQMATRRGVRLLQLFDSLGIPLKDGKSGAITETSLRYTTKLEDDYTCLVNSRCATCLLQSFHKALCADAKVFDKWVTYWDTMQHRVAWSRRQPTAGVLHCHMRRAFGIADAEVCGRVMEVRVLCLRPGNGVTEVFSIMNRIQHTVPWKQGYGKVPAVGSPGALQRAIAVGGPS